jgi:lipopolysaccharide export system protein LptA
LYAKTRHARLAGLLCAALTLGHAATVVAEKADRDKPVNIEADRLTVDDNRQVSVFEGRVVITQGTMQLRADRVVVRQDSDGFQFGIATGNLATFRQKREGVDEWVDGEAERIEYDGKKEFVEFFQRAKLRRDLDETRGNYIAYDAKTEFFRVQSAKDASPTAASQQNARVRAIIQPKAKDNPAAPASSVGAKPAAAAPASSIGLKPAPGIANPRPE